MKKIICGIVSILMLSNIACFALALDIEEATTSTLVADVGQMIMSATPEERKEILIGLIIYMLFIDGQNSVNEAFEGLGDEVITTEIADDASVNETIEYPIIFDDHGFEVYLTGWESCDFYGGDIGYEFSITVYNNSDNDYEFGVKKLKINGWNIHDEGTYSSIVRLDAGEKTRDTWQISGVFEKAGLSSLADVEEISGLFFLGDADSWGDEIVTKEIIITAEDIAQIKCLD